MWITFAQVIDSLLIADHAAHHCDKQIAAFGLGMFQLSKLIMGLLFGRFAHATRIEDHEVSLIHAGFFPTQFIEDGLDALGVSLVHLAANSPDVIFPSRNTGGRGHRVAPLRAWIINVTCYQLR